MKRAMESMTVLSTEKEIRLKSEQTTTGHFLANHYNASHPQIKQLQWNKKTFSSEVLLDASVFLIMNHFKIICKLVMYEFS